jgi:hypothetical protein
MLVEFEKFNFIQKANQQPNKVKVYLTKLRHMVLGQLFMQYKIN